MSDERLMILKLLQDERISLEEAEALLAALEPEQNEGDNGSAFGLASSDGQDDSSRSADFPIEGLTKGLREGLSGIGKTVRAAMAQAFGAHKETRRFSQKFPSDSLDSLVLNNQWGDISVGGYDGDEIILEADVTVFANDEQGGRDILDQLAIDLVPKGNDGHLTLETGSVGPQGLRAKVDYTLTIPRNLKLQAESQGGNVHVENMLTALELGSQSGDMKLTNIEGWVEGTSASGSIFLEELRGSCKLYTASGDIEVRGKGQQVQLKSESGDVKAWGFDQAQVKTASGDILIHGISTGAVLESMSGSITVGIEATMGAQVSLATMSGDITWEVPESSVERKDHKLKATIGSGDHSLKASTMSGDVTVRVEEGHHD